MLLRIKNTDGWAHYARKMKGAIVEVDDNGPLDRQKMYNCRLLVQLEAHDGFSNKTWDHLTITGDQLEKL